MKEKNLIYIRNGEGYDTVYAVVRNLWLLVDGDDKRYTVNNTQFAFVKHNENIPKEYHLKHTIESEEGISIYLGYELEETSEFLKSEHNEECTGWAYFVIDSETEILKIYECVGFPLIFSIEKR